MVGLFMENPTKIDDDLGVPPGLKETSNSFCFRCLWERQAMGAHLAPFSATCLFRDPERSGMSRHPCWVKKGTIIGDYLSWLFGIAIHLDLNSGAWYDLWHGVSCQILSCIMVCWRAWELFGCVWMLAFPAQSHIPMDDFPIFGFLCFVGFND